MARSSNTPTQTNSKLVTPRKHLAAIRNRNGHNYCPRLLTLVVRAIRFPPSGNDRKVNGKTVGRRPEN
jgi:hypothetical protein